MMNICLTSRYILKNYDTVVIIQHVQVVRANDSLKKKR